MGIGRRMVEVLVGWARAQGHLRKIDLHVRTDNRTAIRLYRSLGFRIEGCIRRDFLIAGRFYDSYRMGLMLAPANDGSPATDRSPAK
jgi:RimJ/RimL family protein N-acetyltransferase